MLRGTVDRVRFRGASLEGNALGDPVERELIVYLPPSYAGDSGRGRHRPRRYPVVMVLAGFAATNSSLLSFKPWEPNLLERYERAIELGCGEAIIVLPDCFTRLGGSQYLDSPALGNYQSYLADDVLPWVDKHYCTLPQRGARAIVGKSSGGFGALRMGMDRPDQFAVIGSHAGDCGFELCLRPRFVEVAAVYERHGGADGFLRQIQMQGAPRSQGEFHALEFLALAHAYAPIANIDAGSQDGSARHPPNNLGELPFDPYTALIVPEKWARWRAHDPAERSVAGLRDARLVFLDAGKSDEYGLQFGARILAERLIGSGVAVDHEEFEGGHMGTAYRYDVSLPKIIAALDQDSETQPTHPSPFSSTHPHTHAPCSSPATPAELDSSVDLTTGAPTSSSAAIARNAP
jgi:enterochelin esterase-like enzyme